MRTRLSIYSDLPAQGGELLIPMMEGFSGGYVRAVDGRHSAVTYVGKSSELATLASPKLCLVSEIETGEYYHWRLANAKIRLKKADVEFVWDPVDYFFRDLGVVSYTTTPGAAPRMAFSVVGETVSNLWTRLIGPALLEKGINFVTLGTVTPTQQLTFDFDSISFLSLFELLAEKTGYDLVIRATGTYGYSVSWEAAGALAPRARVSQGFNMLDLSTAQSRTDMVSALLVRGMRYPDSLDRPGLEQCVWKISASSSGDRTLLDPMGSPGPIGMDDLLVENVDLGIPKHYLREIGDDSLHEILASSAPNVVTIASTTALPVGTWVEFVRASDDSPSVAQGVTELLSPLGFALGGRIQGVHTLEIAAARNYALENAFGSVHTGTTPVSYYGVTASTVGLSGSYVGFLDNVPLKGLPPGVTIPTGSMVQFLAPGHWNVDDPLVYVPTLGQLPTPLILSVLGDQGRRDYQQVRRVMADATVDGGGEVTLSFTPHTVPYLNPGSLAVVRIGDPPDGWVDVSSGGPLLGGTLSTVAIRRPSNLASVSGQVANTQRGQTHIRLVNGGLAWGSYNVGDTVVVNGDSYEIANVPFPSPFTLNPQVVVMNGVTQDNKLHLALAVSSTEIALVDVSPGDPVTVDGDAAEIDTEFVLTNRLTLSGLPATTLYPGDVVRTAGGKAAVIENTVVVSGGEATVALSRPITVTAGEGVTVQRPPFLVPPNSGTVTGIMAERRAFKPALDLEIVGVPFIPENTTAWASVAISIWAPFGVELEGEDDTAAALRMPPGIEVWDADAVGTTRGALASTPVLVGVAKVAEHYLDPVTLAAGTLYETTLRCPFTIPEGGGRYFIRVVGAGRNVPYPADCAKGEVITFIRGSQIHVSPNPSVPISTGATANLLWADGLLRLGERHIWPVEYQVDARDPSSVLREPADQPFQLGQTVRALSHTLNVDVPLRLIQLKALDWHDRKKVQIVLSTVRQTGPQRLVKAIRDFEAGVSSGSAGAGTGLQIGGGSGVVTPPPTSSGGTSTSSGDKWFQRGAARPSTRPGQGMHALDPGPDLDFRQWSGSAWQEVLESYRGALRQAINDGGRAAFVLIMQELARRGESWDDDGRPIRMGDIYSDGFEKMLDAALGILRLPPTSTPLSENGTIRFDGTEFKFRQGGSEVTL